MFGFKREERGAVAVLILHGSLDAFCADKLKAEVVSLAGSPVRKVVVDLDDLEFIDSTGVAVLISLFKRMRAVDGEVRFAGLSGQPRELIRVLRLDRALDFRPTAAEALAELAGG